MPLFSVSFFLKNDSRYPLNAQVFDSIGKQLAIIPLAPGQVYLYDIDQPTFEPNTNEPYTPFTVIFLCRASKPYHYDHRAKAEKDKSKDGQGNTPKTSSYVDQFGVWTAVPRGALVTAMASPKGSKSCIMEKAHDDKETHIPVAKKNIYNGNTWSNDGGQSWTNDSGTGYKECIDGDVNCYNKLKNRKKAAAEKAQREALNASRRKKSAQKTKEKKGYSSFGAWSRNSPDGQQTQEETQNILKESGESDEESADSVEQTSDVPFETEDREKSSLYNSISTTTTPQDKDDHAPWDNDGSTPQKWNNDGTKRWENDGGKKFKNTGDKPSKPARSKECPKGSKNCFHGEPVKGKKKRKEPAKIAPPKKQAEKKNESKQERQELKGEKKEKKLEKKYDLQHNPSKETPLPFYQTN